MSIYNYMSYFLTWFSTGNPIQYRIPPPPPQPPMIIGKGKNKENKENKENKPKLSMMIKNQFVFEKDEILNSLRKLKRIDKDKLYVKKTYVPEEGVMGELHKKVKRID